MRKGFKIALVVFILLTLLAGGGVWYVWNGMQPVAKQDQAVEVLIERGSGTGAIAEQLEKNGIIKNAALFKVYLKMNGEGSKFMAGKYVFQPGVNYEDIIASLNSGNVVKDEMVRFTIPEGYTVEQIALELSSKGIVEQSDFMNAIDDAAAHAERLPFQMKLPKDTNIKHSLEGYLFPETYEMKKGSTAEQIVDRMLQETEKKITQLTNWEADMKQKGLTLHELLTVASLVEREVVVDEERPIVAGVIYNRIFIEKMPLQIDATVQYALDKPKERLYYKDLEIDSPYNTYKIAGLPPGPIASPSIASIEAALHPETTEFLYYVTKKDGTQSHLFAKTYAEHLRNIEKSKQ
ncbi:endolytic transglycosylase MltG [Paenibacillus taiwanensis]|uniref:endolytic transglycosylase MltG n=1 Tax=Paenibacillus taiwanensis TaxID=401638 RepID=UPI000422F558|nr:endolytic transglycosylase MltG [Paenibacillus taiwanensis]